MLYPDSSQGWTLLCLELCSWGMLEPLLQLGGNSVTDIFTALSGSPGSSGLFLSSDGGVLQDNRLYPCSHVLLVLHHYDVHLDHPHLFVCTWKSHRDRNTLVLHSFQSKFIISVSPFSGERWGPTLYCPVILSLKILPSSAVSSQSSKAERHFNVVLTTFFFPASL